MTMMEEMTMTITMTKKHFIDLADAIRSDSMYSASCKTPVMERTVSMGTLVRFMRSQNPAFKEGLWLAYVDGKCGPNGGTLKGEGD